MVLLSADLALNHSGIIILKDGKLLDYKNIISPKKNKKMSNDVYNILRLDFLLASAEALLKNYKIDYAVIEDYSFGSKSSSIFQIGGYIEGFKLILFKNKIPMRLVSPKSGKLYASGKGDASKEEIINVVKNNWEKLDFEKLLFPKKKKITKNDMALVEDLCDAYCLSRLLHDELMLRKGKIKLSSLEEHKIKVFNRVTVKRPENILSLDFIENKEN